jgi:predicted secreted protein
MYKLDKRPSCDKVDVQTWQTPIMWQGRCTNLTNTPLSHDGCLSSLYIYLVTWWVFVKFVHLSCHMMGVCQVCTSTLSHDRRLSSLYIYLVTWWAFVKFVHLPCHMMVVCQVCTSTLSHDGSHHVTRYMNELDKHPSCDKVDVQTWETPIILQGRLQTWQTTIMWQGRCANLTNTHHVTR